MRVTGVYDDVLGRRTTLREYLGVSKRAQWCFVLVKVRLFHGLTPGGYSGIVTSPVLV